MQISSSLLSQSAYRRSEAPAGPRQNQNDFAAARAESLEERRRFEAIEARNADGIANMAKQGLVMTQHSFVSDYKQELAQSIDTDGDGTLGVAELAAGLGADHDTERARRLHDALDIDGDGRVGLVEFGDSVRDPFRDAGFRRQLELGTRDPAAIGALYRRQAEQYDARSVLGSMARAIDTAA